MSSGQLSEEYRNEPPRAHNSRLPPHHALFFFPGRGHHSQDSTLASNLGVAYARRRTRRLGSSLRCIWSPANTFENLANNTGDSVVSVIPFETLKRKNKNTDRYCFQFEKTSRNLVVQASPERLSLSAIAPAARCKEKERNETNGGGNYHRTLLHCLRAKQTDAAFLVFFSFFLLLSLFCVATERF